MFARCSLAALPDSLLECMAVNIDPGANPDVVDRNASVLAEQIVGLLCHHDIFQHGGQDVLGGSVRFSRIQAAQAGLDVWRQLLERANIQLLGGLLDRHQIYLHVMEQEECYHAPKQRSKSMVRR